MTDKAVSALTSLTGANTATGDLVYIVDISEASAADRSKKITAEELQNYMKKFPATIGVGGATPAASGSGITFPASISASSDANTLDDYEEGTWTTTIGGEENCSSVSLAQAYYVKIGRLVHLQGYFALTVTTSDLLTYFYFSIPFDMTAGENRPAGAAISNSQFALGAIYPAVSVANRLYLIIPPQSEQASGADNVAFSITYYAA